MVIPSMMSLEELTAFAIKSACITADYLGKITHDTQQLLQEMKVLEARVHTLEQIIASTTEEQHGN